MAARKGLFRLAILILLIPVGLLLVLHFFGENRMDVQVLGSVEGCIEGKTSVLLTGGDFDTNQKNQITRIKRQLEKKRLKLKVEFDSCFQDTVALHLIDKKKNLRGSYFLEQSEVNRLFVELDIVLMHDNYGESVSR